MRESVSHTRICEAEVEARYRPFGDQASSLMICMSVCSGQVYEGEQRDARLCGRLARKWFLSAKLRTNRSRCLAVSSMLRSNPSKSD